MLLIPRRKNSEGLTFYYAFNEYVYFSNHDDLFIKESSILGVIKRISGGVLRNFSINMKIV